MFNLYSKSNGSLPFTRVTAYNIVFPMLYTVADSTAKG